MAADDEDDDDDDDEELGEVPDAPSRSLDPRSDDSMDNDDDQGIVMRKTGRRTLAGRRLFSFEDDEDDEDDGDDEDDKKGEADVFERLGIKVRSPKDMEDGDSTDEEAVAEPSKGKAKKDEP